jgi:hypothetical protein
MTAYMWQAITPSDKRAKGLGRRAFRLEEEQTIDTVSRDSIDAKHADMQHFEDTVRSTAKVTIVKSSRTKNEILYVAGRGTRPNSDKELFDIFVEVLADHGSQLDIQTSPVITGLTLDAHYDQRNEQAAGHMSTGRHSPREISLGTFGSYMTYSWPRFTEEVNSCLTDGRIPGAKFSNGKSSI